MNTGTKITSLIFIILLSVFLPASFTPLENNGDFLPGQIFAQNPDLQEKITLLKQQIVDLQTKMAELKLQLAEIQKTEEVPKTEIKFTKTLYREMMNEEVKQLQDFLKQFPDIYPEGLVTGYFGFLTETAVKKFQEKYGIESIGVVGPETRAKLNELKASLTFKPPPQPVKNTTSTSTAERKPNPEKCPDGIWDEAEQKDPTLCPEDYGKPAASSSPSISTTTPPQTTQPFSPSPFTSTVAILFKWTKDSGIRVSGGLVPFVYKLKDGRFRMYYCGTNGSIMSVISSDGFSFQSESGARLTPIFGGYETIICDPTLVELSDGRFRLYYKGANAGGGSQTAIHKIFSAISSDGLNFQREGVVIDSEKTDDRGWASVPEAIKLPDGRIRLYYVSGSSRGIVSAISSDGLNFTKEETQLFDYVDPSIIQLSDGSFLFAAPLFQNGVGTGIYSFVSDDGIHFDTANPQPVLIETGVGDQTIAKINDKTYRIYYWNLQDSSPAIYSLTGTLNQ